MWPDLAEAEALIAEELARYFEKTGQPELAALIVVAVRDPKLFERAVKAARRQL